MIPGGNLRKISGRGSCSCMAPAAAPAADRRIFRRADKVMKRQDISSGNFILSLKRGALAVMVLAGVLLMPFAGVRAYAFGPGDYSGYSDGSSQGTALGTAAITGGQWVGYGDNWSYVKDGAIVTGWAVIENTFATTEQHSYDWFYFDEKGKLKVGWFTDTNGDTYYLNPIHDNTFGALCTGWYYIGGSWYYFEEKNASRLGALYRNTLTPDNYVVDANGKLVK